MDLIDLNLLQLKVMRLGEQMTDAFLWLERLYLSFNEFLLLRYLNFFDAIFGDFGDRALF